MTGLQQLQSVLNSFRYYLKSGSINEQRANELKQALKEGIPFFCCPMTNKLIFPDLKRVTINKYLFGGKNISIEDIDKLKYPPSDNVTRNGRANYIGQSALYATFNPLTALNEMKP